MPSEQSIQNPAMPISGLKPAPAGLRFEEAQKFLQRAIAQLKVDDQAKEESRDRIAAIREQIMRDTYEKDVMFDHEIDEEMHKEYEFMMNPKKLAELEFKLSLTPAGLAARYLRWLHEWLGTEEPNPLAGWRKELEIDIDERYGNLSPYRIFRGAERQLFALVGMYVSAILNWFEEFCAAMTMDVLATAYTTRNQRASLEIDARLADHAHRLRVSAAVVKIIEDHHLRESVLPAALRTALDPNQLRFIAASSLDRSAECSSTPSDAELTAEAQSRVQSLLTTALATANLTHCHQLLFSLAQASLTLGDRRRDYDLWMHLLEPARRDTAPSKRPPADRAGEPPRPRPSKPRRPRKSTTSTSQPNKVKTHKKKRIYR